MGSGQDGMQVKQETGIEALCSRLRANNEQGHILLVDLRAFVSRMTGQNLVDPPQGEVATAGLDGAMAAIDRALGDQATTNDEMREAMLAIEKIG